MYREKNQIIIKHGYILWRMLFHGFTNVILVKAGITFKSIELLWLMTTYDNKPSQLNSQYDL